MKHKDLKALESMLPKVVESLNHLHKVTGKWGFHHIYPLEEKRWSEKCWACYSLLVDVHGLIADGETFEEFASTVEFPTSEWIGTVEMGKFEAATKAFDALEKIYPDCSKWKPVDSSCIGEPCDPTPKPPPGSKTAP